MTLKITSTAFEAGAEIPAIYTCEGDDISPPLSFSGEPPGAKSLALIVDDPDAPDPEAPRMIWTHWVLYNIPAGTAGLAEGAASRELPGGTKQGTNDWHRIGYRGPCPPVGRHRYFHKLYALDAYLADLKQPTKAELERAMNGHILAEASLIGTFRRRR